MVKTRKKEINFYKRYLYNPEKEALKRKIIIGIIPLAVLLLIVAGWFTYLKISGAMMNKEMDDINAYLSSQAISEQYARSQTLAKDKEHYADVYDQLGTLIKQIKGYPAMGSEIMGQVQICMSGFKLMGYTYDASAGTLSINAQTSAVTNMPPLVKRLKGTGIFSDVGYTGYETNDETYNATINCVMFR